MQLFRTLEDLAGHSRKVCLAIGTFDGVHLGHQRVIGQARDDARASGGTSVVLTFDPHPMRVLQPQQGTAAVDFHAAQAGAIGETRGGWVSAAHV
jgi:riboflavin kinase / FMN adenylyltransferase